MMSCGRCSRWQHIQCHDRADKAAGRPLRNWDSVEFICWSCRAAQQDGRREYNPPATQHPPVSQNHNVPQIRPYGSYQSTSTMHIPVEGRSSGSQYMSPYRDTAQQSYYVRPPNGGHLPPQGGYQGSVSYPSSSHSQDPTAQSAISFSHYQPAAHGFSTNTQKAHVDPRYASDHSNHHQPYHNSAQQYVHPQHSPQQYRPDVPSSYKPSVRILLHHRFI